MNSSNSKVKIGISLNQVRLPSYRWWNFPCERKERKREKEEEEEKEGEEEEEEEEEEEDDRRRVTRRTWRK